MGEVLLLFLQIWYAISVKLKIIVSVSFWPSPAVSRHDILLHCLIPHSHQSLNMFSSCWLNTVEYCFLHGNCLQRCLLTSNIAHLKLKVSDYLKLAGVNGILDCSRRDRKRCKWKKNRKGWGGSSNGHDTTRPDQVVPKGVGKFCSRILQLFSTQPNSSLLRFFFFFLLCHCYRTTSRGFRTVLTAGHLKQTIFGFSNLSLSQVLINFSFNFMTYHQFQSCVTQLRTCNYCKIPQKSAIRRLKATKPHVRCLNLTCIIFWEWNK